MSILRQGVRNRYFDVYGERHGVKNSNFMAFLYHSKPKEKKTNIVIETGHEEQK